MDPLQRITIGEPVDNPTAPPVDNPPGGDPDTTSEHLTEDERLELLIAWKTTHTAYAQIAHDPRNDECIRDTYHTRIGTLASAIRKATALPQAAL